MSDNSPKIGITGLNLFPSVYTFFLITTLFQPLFTPPLQFCLHLCEKYGVLQNMSAIKPAHSLMLLTSPNLMYFVRMPTSSLSYFVTYSVFA